MFKIIAEQGNARTGILKTKTGEYETPFFMPVATKATTKALTTKQLEEIGVKNIISNSLILYLRPGLEVIKKHKGIHNFMNFKGCVFTDSGGFQILSKSFLIKSDIQGVHFKSPFDGKRHYLKPEDVMKIEESIGADVAMAFDMVPHYGTSKKHIADCVRKTAFWAQRCKDSHKKKDQLLFGITQGGIFKDLREQSAKDIVDVGFDGIALGGLCFGEPKKEMDRIVEVSKKIIPKEYPIYLMGVGSPHDLVDSVYHGVDCFDSRLPTMNARHGTLFTKNGTINLKNRKHKMDTKPIEKGCTCFTCKNYTRAYLAYLLRFNEGAGMQLATIHNLHFIVTLMDHMRTEIKAGTFELFRKKFFRNYAYNDKRGSFTYS